MCCYWFLIYSPTLTILPTILFFLKKSKTENFSTNTYNVISMIYTFFYFILFYFITHNTLIVKAIYREIWLFFFFFLKSPNKRLKWVHFYIWCSPSDNIFLYLLYDTTSHWNENVQKKKNEYKNRKSYYIMSYLFVQFK